MVMHINLAGVLLAGLSSMAVGSVYYADAVYGKAWKKLAKIDEKKLQKTMPKVMPLVFLAALVTAYTVAYMTTLYHGFFQVSWLSASLTVSLLLWLGVSATTLFVHNSLDQRPPNLTLIAAGNRLLSLLAMGLLIGWLHP